MRIVVCAVGVITAWSTSGFAQTPPAPGAPTPAPPQAAAQAAIDEEDLQLKLAEPDFAIVNLPTTLRLPRRAGNFRLTHRFLANLRVGSFTSHLDNLFGLDNGAIIGLEFRFAPIRSLQVIVHRNSLDKTIQFAGQYSAIRQGGASPVGIDGIVSIEGTNNFKSGDDDGDGGEHDHSTGAGGHKSPAIGAVVSRTVGDRLALYAMPMWVHHTLALEGQHRDTTFIGLGGRARLTSKVYIVGEVSPRLAGYQPGDPEFAFGIERRAGGHMFQLTFTNSFAGTEAGASGTVTIRLNLTRDSAQTITAATVDFQASMTGFPAGSAISIAHIHEAAAGVVGGIVVNTGLTLGEVTLVNGAGSFTKNGVNTTPEIAQRILNNPAGFYFNVHSSANPGGVIRGQLVRTQ